MPTYDYQCRACGSMTEVIHSMLEDGPTVCERCGGDLRRVIYPSGIIFKGSGFYRTDSRASTSSSGSGTDANAPSKSGEGSTPAAAKGADAGSSGATKPASSEAG